jgi:hypothetical protein
VEKVNKPLWELKRAKLSTKIKINMDKLLKYLLAFQTFYQLVNN